MIRKNFVLTAAHCLTREGTVRDLLGPVKVYAGEVVYDRLFTRHTTPIKAKKLIPHEKWDHIKSKPYYDIGLIQLVSDVKITPDINIAKLPSEYPPDRAQVCMVGWGQTSTGYEPAFLMHSYMEIKNYCDQEAGAEEWSVFCMNGEAAPCSGDSGGPTFLDKSNVIVGVHSTSVIDAQTGECALNKDYIDVSVQFHLDWIKKKIKARIAIDKKTTVNPNPTTVDHDELRF